MRGVYSHGVSLLPTYVRRLRKGLTNPRPQIRLVQERGATAVLDGDAGMGHVIGHAAMAAAMERARAFGIGLVSVRNSTHYGMAGYYAMLALGDMMIGYTTSNATADMVPWQGADPVLANNPLAYAVPARRHAPLVLDMACSVVARGRIRLAQITGGHVPAGWVFGGESDPERAYSAPLMPMGAYKGSGLSIVNEVLAAALPAAKLSIDIRQSAPVVGEPRNPRGVGHTFMAIDVAALRPVEEFLAQVDAFLDAVKSARPASGYDEVLLPGEIERRNHAAAVRDGIPLHDGVIGLLRALGRETGVAFD
jgi:LDH2 family malate/lactate/ureidoglycolate dehydrogenase